MELTSLLIFAGALLVAAGSPGPSIAALVARVISRGFRDVFPFLAAMWIGEAIWLSMAVFYLALLPTIIDLGAVTLLGWAELTLTMAIVLVAIDLTWVLAAAQARRLLKSERAMRIANRVSAATMGGAAAAIAARS